MKHSLPIGGLFLLAALPGAGQGLTSQGAVISIQSGAQMSVVGNVSIGTGGTIDNAGTLSLSGNWDNSAGSGVLTPGTGTVKLNGTATQQIGGSSVTTFHSLDLSTAIGPVQLMVNTSVGSSDGVLALGATKLQLNSKVLTLNNGAPSALTNTTGQLVSETTPAAGYGRLLWVIGTNTGTYVIPMGTGTVALPITAAITTPGVGAAGTLDVATYPTLTTNLPLPTGVTRLNGDANKTLDRFWIIQPTGYTTTPAATLSMVYRDAEWNTAPNTITESRLRLQRWNGNGGFEAPQGSVNTTANTLTSGLQNNFGIFAAADMATPLPVELKEFTAQSQNADGILKWVTASELNNKGFDVQVSLDGQTFRSLGFVAGHGTTSAPQQYRFTDTNAARRGSRQFYRLHQLDTNGTSTYSPVRVVSFAESGAAALAVWPNPAQNAYTILLTAAHAQAATIVVRDVLGRLAGELPVQLQAGENRLPAVFGLNQPAGVYLLSTVLDGQAVRTRLVRE